MKKTTISILNNATLDFPRMIQQRYLTNEPSQQTCPKIA